MSRIEDAVARRLIERADEGKRKYGTTMEREDLTLLEWLQHLQEEMLDASVYIEKIKQELHYQDLNSINEATTAEDIELGIYGVQRGPCSGHDAASEEHLKSVEQYMEEEAERRMNIIGQNGNEGTHYDEANYMYDKANWNNKTAIQKHQQGAEHTNNCGCCTVTRSVYPGDINVTYQYETKTS